MKASQACYWSLASEDAKPRKKRELVIARSTSRVEAYLQRITIPSLSGWMPLAVTVAGFGGAATSPLIEKAEGWEPLIPITVRPDDVISLIAKRVRKSRTSRDARLTAMALGAVK